MQAAVSAFVATTTIAASAAAVGSWHVQEEISPLDDSKNVGLWTESLEPIPDTFGRLVTPTLVLRCQENKTSVYIDWSTYLGIDEIQIIYRIDKLPAETRRWRISTNFEAIGLWSGGSAIPFIRGLFDHKTLLARVTPYGESPVTVIFNIAGLKAAAAPLMEACHWQPRAPQERPGTPQQEFQELLHSVEKGGRLSIGEIDALMRQVGGGWTLPTGIDGIWDMVVRLRIQVRPDRTVQDVTIQDQARLDRDPVFRAVAESARRAVEICSPLNLPRGKYAQWRELEMNFYPEYAIGG